MSTIGVKLKRLHPDARIPAFGTAGAACFDLHAIDTANAKQHPIDPFATIFRTGLAFGIPDGHVMLVFSRSGHGFKDAVRLSNCVGVIDHDYTGEVMVSLRRDEAAHSVAVGDGDRIAQAMVIPRPLVRFIEVDELDETERGAGGFGSTGA